MLVCVRSFSEPSSLIGEREVVHWAALRGEEKEGHWLAPRRLAWNRGGVKAGALSKSRGNSREDLHCQQTRGAVGRLAKDWR